MVFHSLDDLLRKGLSVFKIYELPATVLLHIERQLIRHFIEPDMEIGSRPPNMGFFNGDTIGHCKRFILDSGELLHDVLGPWLYAESLLERLFLFNVQGHMLKIRLSIRM